MSRMRPLLLTTVAVVLAGCGSPNDSVTTSGVPETSASIEMSTSPPAIEVTSAPSASMLLAGLPAGISESFRPPGDLESVIGDSALTAVARLEGYELNPAAERGRSLPEVYVPGYAGPRGVLRLIFEVENVVGGRDATLQEIGGTVAGRIAVDLEHWLAPEQQSTQNEALDELVGRPERYVLVLRTGEVDGVPTGAYRLWGEPHGMGSYREDQSGGELRMVHPDHELVLREAVQRGATVTTTTPHPTEDMAGEVSSAQPEGPSPGSPEPFASGEGMSVETFLARYKTG